MGTRRQLSTIAATDGFVSPANLRGGGWFGQTDTAGQSVPSTPPTDVVVQFPSTEWNNGGITVSGTGNTAFTVGAGIWLVTATVRFSGSSGGGERYLMLGPALGNTSTRYAHTGLTPGVGERSLSCTAMVRTTTTAAISAYVWHDAGVNLTLMRAAHLAHRMQIVYLGKP